MKRIVFILNSIQIPRAVKRINGFKEAGYDIEVYTFVRTDVVDSPLNIQFDYKVVGEFPNAMPYYKRLWYMFNALKREKNYKKKEVELYYFGLDAAIVGKLAYPSYSYIYEEADLVHTYIPNKFVQRIMEYIDKSLIRNSALTIFTSEGFVDYHFDDEKLDNAIILSNKLIPSITKLPLVEKRALDINHLRIGFVGSFRFSTVINFCKVFVAQYPQHELHVYGLMDDNENNKSLLSFPNFHWHGPFKNPDDLPGIYSQIDLSLSTYDANTVNARYAEPNKLYEAIYFETPIIASSNTFVADKVRNLGIGFDIDASKDDEIMSFVSQLTEEKINNVKENIRLIDKYEAINDNTELLKRINSLLNIEETYNLTNMEIKKLKNTPPSGSS